VDISVGIPAVRNSAAALRTVTSTHRWGSLRNFIKRFPLQATRLHE
jgi:hypothetical protein